MLKRKWFLYLTEFFSGMSVMAIELGASRLLAPYFSSSQIVWTIIIGAIMIAMALGNIWGGRLADKIAQMEELNASCALTMGPDFDHVVPDWEAIMTLGLPGLRERARAYR